MLCHVHKGAPGNGWEDGIRLRRHHLAVLCDKQEIGSPRLLNIGPGTGIQEHVLVISRCMGCDRSVKAHGVVQSGLYVAGAVGRRPVKVADAKGQRFCSSLKIRPYRRSKKPELILLGRLNTDDRT